MARRKTSDEGAIPSMTANDPTVPVTVQERLREGIAAAKAGQRERARDLLMHVVEEDEENLQAWLWLSGVMDGLDDKEVCLENALELDPANEAARKGLVWVRQQKGFEPATASQPSPDIERGNPPARRAVSTAAAILGDDFGRRRVTAEPALPASAAQPAAPPAPRANTAAAAILREDFARRQPPPEPELPPPVPPPDEFADEYLCPYCAAPTRPEERLCPACGRSLWVKVRRREEYSSWLWVAIVMQLGGTVWPMMLPLTVLTYVAYQVKITNPFDLIPAYLGLPSSVPPEAASAAFKIVPGVYLLPFAVYFVFSSVVLAGLVLRWRPIFYLFLVSALLMIASSVVTAVVVEGGNRLCSAAGIIPGILMLLMIFQLEDDFFTDDRRLVLRADRDATNGPAMLASGQRYAKHGMWALAAIHLRRAAAKMPHEIAPALMLTAVYLNLKRYDLAEKSLAQARSLDPADPQVEKLAATLMERR
jgi:tetratricopeptide (TPR) repeat protein